MSDGPLTKASIYTVEGPKLQVDCLFNPKEYTVAKTNNWGPADNSTKDAYDLTFSGGSGAKLTMQLFFDTYLRDSQTSVLDVRTHTDVLWQMMNICEDLRDPKTKKGRPPKVMFMWGKNWLFNAVITSMQQQYTLFMPNGMPVRAMVSVEFQEALEHKTLMEGEGTYQISERVRQDNQGYAGDLREKYSQGR